MRSARGHQQYCDPDLSRFPSIRYWQRAVGPCRHWINRETKSSAYHWFSLRYICIRCAVADCRFWLCTGIGYGMVLVSGIVCIYYNLILAWALYYLSMSFTMDQLPWVSCNNVWNTKNCRQRNQRWNHNWTFLNGTNTTGYGGVLTMAEGLERRGEQFANMTTNVTINGTEIKTSTPAEEFWQ